MDIRTPIGIILLTRKYIVLGGILIIDKVRTQGQTDPAFEYPGPILLFAGPGTGKTFSLAKRIKYLVEKMEVSPEVITAITFTGEAAANLRAEISDEDKEVFVPAERQPRWIRTMHSLGYEIVKACYRRLGLRKEFRVVADSEVLEILAADAASLCSLPRDNAKTMLECRRLGDCRKSSEKKCAVCIRYQTILRHQNSVDYDDLIFLAIKVLVDKKNTSIIDQFRSRTQHFLVDEYQDINAGQFRLIRLLNQGQEAGLYVVGDDDQSIYSWRGGSPRYILEFVKDFGQQSKVCELNECRRCPPKILNGALSLIEKNTPYRRPKPNMKSIRSGDQAIEIYNAPSAQAEAKFIINNIKRLGESPNILILMPRMNLAGPIRKSLRNAGISYECKFDVEQMGFFRVDAVGDWIEEKQNNLLLRLCIDWIISNRDLKLPQKANDTKEGLQKSVSALWDILSKKRISLLQALETESHTSGKLALIHSQLSKWNTTSKPEEYLKKIIYSTRPWASTKSLIKEVSEWIDEGGSQGSTGSRTIRIMTMQRAKGLTVDYVFVIGLEQGIFPREAIDELQFQEARRLFYVSMTRARKQLWLCHARKRPGNIGYGARGLGNHTSVLEPSQFLNDIDIRFKTEIGWR